jgi:hypothetical protein
MNHAPRQKTAAQIRLHFLLTDLMVYGILVGIVCILTGMVWSAITMIMEN